METHGPREASLRSAEREFDILAERLHYVLVETIEGTKQIKFPVSKAELEGLKWLLPSDLEMLEVLVSFDQFFDWVWNEHFLRLRSLRDRILNDRKSSLRLLGEVFVCWENVGREMEVRLNGREGYWRGTAIDFLRANSSSRKLEPKETGHVFRREDGGPLTADRLDQQHARIRGLLKFPADFVLHSLRHTFGTRLGESGADAVTIMRLMGHSTVTVSQRYVHASPQAVERAFERLNAMNLQRVPTNCPTVGQADSSAVQ